MRAVRKIKMAAPAWLQVAGGGGTCSRGPIPLSPPHKPRTPLLLPWAPEADLAQGGVQVCTWEAVPGNHGRKWQGRKKR